MKTKETKSLKELAEVWMAMERKTLDQRKKAEQYYEEHLMPPIIENYKERNADQVFEQVDYLILSVGTSCLYVQMTSLSMERGSEIRGVWEWQK